MQGICMYYIKKTLAPWKKSCDKPIVCIEKQRHHFVSKGPYSQSHDFSSSHVWMWELDHKEGWAPKNWCFWILVLNKTLQSPWRARRSNQPTLKEINPEYSLEGLMFNFKLQYFAHLMRRANSLENTLMLGKIESRRRRRWQDEMVEWHHQLSGHGFAQTPGDSEGQGILVHCIPWITKS